jgi:hypothetical protein
MKNGLKKRGKYYHYKHWDNRIGKNVWRSTRETTWERANLWVEANVLNPKREKLLDEALGLKPIKRASFREFVEKEYWPYARLHNRKSTVQANFYKMNWLEQFFGGSNDDKVLEGDARASPRKEDLRIRVSWTRREEKGGCQDRLQENARKGGASGHDLPRPVAQLRRCVRLDGYDLGANLCAHRPQDLRYVPSIQASV